MKKNILFHIGSFDTGGAEKSLVSLLNTLPKDKYNIDVLVYEKKGTFLTLVPEYINIIEMPIPLKCIVVSPLSINFYLKHSPILLLRKFIGILKMKSYKHKYAIEQTLWNHWKKYTPTFNKEYDVALSYIEGFTNYFVIDKITARKKFLWIHNEYDKLNYNKNFDKKYFIQATAVITISSICKNNLIKNFPDLKEHFLVIENISNPDLIHKMALEPIENKYFQNNKSTIKLLSIGRLAPQKNYKLAIEAAEILNQKKLSFEWIIIGEGPLREELEKLRDKKGLNDKISFIGVRSNPYAFMNRADIIIQSSLYEGKSIAIDEAKILHKPIVCTNYATVHDIIKDQETGLIADMTAVSLAESIYKLAINAELRKYLSNNLKKENNNNIKEIDKYIDLIEH